MKRYILINPVLGSEMWLIVELDHPEPKVVFAIYKHLPDAHEIALAELRKLQNSDVPWPFRLNVKQTVHDALKAYFKDNGIGIAEDQNIFIHKVLHYLRDVQ